MIENKLNSTDRKKCTGCHACATVCPENSITMTTDKEGFWYPVVDDSCIDCGECIDVCHIFNNVEAKREPRAFACVHKDESVLLSSSSGGVFHELSKYFIDQNGVVFGAALNDKHAVEHTFTENISDIEKFQGSKYVQSKIGNAYEQAERFLKNGRKVLFSGTPCQIGGLKTFLKKDYESLFCVDFICHGVPSPMVWKKYLEYQEIKHNSSIQDISFRAKDQGWKLFSMKLTFGDSNSYIKPLTSDLFLRAFLKNLCLRPSCHNCDFKTLSRQSDITLADFWAVQKVLPEMYDNRGTSLILINSNTANELFKKISGEFAVKELELDQAVQYSPSAVRSVYMNRRRDAFMQDVASDVSFDKLAKKYLIERKWVGVYNKTKRIVFKLVRK